MTTSIVVQARTGSTRCPGKVLAPLAGAPLLQRMVERVLAACGSFELTIATTRDRADDPIVTIARTLGVRVHRGHPTDLLDRHYRSALEAQADVVVKIPSDCPLIDPEVIERVIAAWKRASDPPDYASNLHPESWPDGNDVEVMALPALATAWREAVHPWEREHTTPYLWDQPDRFRLLNVTWDRGRDLSGSHRFVVDYPEDLAFVRAVYDELWTPRARPFTTEDILDLIDARPWLTQLNAHRAGSSWRNHPDVRLRTRIRSGPHPLGARREEAR